ncbi:sugar-binding transcriptional regulator [Primorskyibacter flagellatus]|uniref:DNA-binding transcriptional regulator LsrR, DeoR family n=1 Tax=Primorskyibacter flagellatus TaxID=1387277 RepID=A0A1W2CDK4_9RHOB|nr:sugar-binding domain-containing protein [Primorskyibacter flagellatus]SMC82942.1 DNA-binding transcriptional regulator LsrR, DeoR family [Primorskyibacter flagellatus]
MHDHDFESQDERARVGWYYFVAGMTQKDIADRLDITRLKVNRIIGQLRSAGQVKIELDMPLIACRALAEKVAERYGLEDVVVVPDVGDLVLQKRMIGEAAGTMVNPLIKGQDMGIGIGSGRTLSYAVGRMAGPPSNGSWVVGLIGGITRATGSNSFDVATNAAQQLGVECHYLTAPIYCASRDARDALLLIDELTDVLARTEIADIAMVSCGAVDEASSLTQVRVIKDHLDTIVAAGAVGEILGCFIDAQGRPIDHFINETIIALPPDKLRMKPHAVLVSGGLHKLEVIRAILRGGYVNRLATNEEVAQALLEC